MPRTDWSVLKGLGGASERTIRPIIDRQVEIVVLRDATIFEESVGQIWDLYNDRWGMFHVNTPFPVSRNELIRYCYTAARARIARVNGERFHTRCDDPWAVPTAIATALAGVGRVSLEMPHMEIVPLWNAEADAMLLNYDETRYVTNRLRAVERDQDAKLLFARAISGDRSGDEALMALVPVRNATGQLVNLASRTDFDPIAGLVYLLLGLEPELVNGVMTLQADGTFPGHPLLMPAAYIRTAALMHQMHRLIEAGVG